MRTRRSARSGMEARLIVSRKASRPTARYRLLVDRLCPPQCDDPVLVQGARPRTCVWTGPSGEHLLVATDGSGTRLGLTPSQSEKTGKNRVHFGRRPDDQQAELQRLEGLGARRVDIGQTDTTWVVMADPEYDEFCVLRSLAQKEQDQSRPSD